MSDTISSALQRLVDQSEIFECLKRCARGMDRHDAEMIASAYHPDAIDDHGSFRGTIAAFIDYVNGSDGTAGVHEIMFKEHLHFLTNHTADIDGDVAHTETYFIMIGRYRDRKGSGVWLGRYVDRLERRLGEWKIAVRRVVMAASAELTGDTTLNAEQLVEFVGSTWDKSDISYQRPLEIPPAS